jgi:hypothetical protein
MVPVQFENWQIFLADHGTHLRMVIIAPSNPESNEQFDIEYFDASENVTHITPDILPQFSYGQWTVAIDKLPCEDVHWHVYHKDHPCITTTKENIDDDHLVLVARHVEA